MIIVKTEQEIDAMREPCAIVRDTLTYIGSLVRPGVSTQELDERAEAYIRSRGAVPSCLGYCGYPASICASVNEEVVHGIPGPRILREGDIVNMAMAEMADAPERLQWAMNETLSYIGIENPDLRARAIDIGERLGVLRDYPTSPGCTSPFAPTWITEMVSRNAAK